MELKDFIKTPKTQKFLHTQYGYIEGKSVLIEAIKEKVREWLAVGEPEKEIKDRAVAYILDNYEPLTPELQSKTKKLMQKWGLSK